MKAIEISRLWLSALLAVLLVVFYVMPYQQAIDEHALTVARQAGR